MDGRGHVTSDERSTEAFAGEAARTLSLTTLDATLATELGEEGRDLALLVGATIPLVPCA